MKAHTMRIVIVILVVVMGIWFWTETTSKSTVVNFNESEIVKRWQTSDGRVAVLVANKLYEERSQGMYVYLTDYYDRDYFDKNYLVKDGETYRVFDNGGEAQLLLENTISDGFESYESITDLMFTADDLVGKEEIVEGVKVYRPGDLDTTWTFLTLQSPAYPTVSDLVKLRHKTLEEGADFVENRVEVVNERAYSGEKSLRFYTVKADSKAPVVKASIATNNVSFKAGDDFWFKAKYYIAEGMPQTIMDLESTWLLESSGIRIAFSENGAPYVELKAFDKPTWRNRDFRMPTDTWVEVKAHLTLDTTDGLVELWIDDELVISGRGQTIPLENVIQDSVEIGISAASEETILYIDDVVISDRPL